MSERVCAVVVTYNRKELLQKCLTALRNQTRKPDHILVVDNASTDGTSEMLKEEFPEVEVLRLFKNQGSAGGFHAGMKRAYEEGFDWFWLMDDDGFPLANTLEQLLSFPIKEVLFRGCVVVAKEEPGLLAFDYPSSSSIPLRSFKELSELYGAQGFVPGFVNPYNGVLVHRRVVESVGLPKAELFIWGDEAEYFWRAKKSGINIATVLSAIFVHPKDRMRKKIVSILGKSIALPYSENLDRFALIVRNQAYIYTRHISCLKWGVRTVLYLITFRHLANMIISASLRGALGRLGK